MDHCPFTAKIFTTLGLAALKIFGTCDQFYPFKIKILSRRFLPDRFFRRSAFVLARWEFFAYTAWRSLTEKIFSRSTIYNVTRDASASRQIEIFVASANTEDAQNFLYVVLLYF